MIPKKNHVWKKMLSKNRYNQIVLKRSVWKYQGSLIKFVGSLSAYLRNSKLKEFFNFSINKFKKTLIENRMLYGFVLVGFITLFHYLLG